MNESRFHLIMALACAALIMSSAALAAPPVVTLTVECSWGFLTIEAIADTSGREAGDHASDPSGDGRGPDDADQPRVGLANIVARGDLQATCEFLEGLGVAE